MAQKNLQHVAALAIHQQAGTKGCHKPGNLILGTAWRNASSSADAAPAGVIRSSAVTAATVPFGGSTAPPGERTTAPLPIAVFNAQVAAPLVFSYLARVHSSKSGERCTGRTGGGRRPASCGLWLARRYLIAPRPPLSPGMVPLGFPFPVTP